MKFIKIDNYLINLDKCIHIHYATSLEKDGEYVLFFDLEEGGSITSNYDDKEKLEEDVALIEDLIGNENMVVL